ncbi:hypothetical protein B5807_02395 [Epicoccum nigrum]|uniref:Uncharacterized protein n=1 Tax=Epicoccum nigrum TaxID=105696 RepID=A0A1Y2MBF4_EPING|nr:hypothetical protein B5807_02395 [Epicoccum nigrum]
MHRLFHGWFLPSRRSTFHLCSFPLRTQEPVSVPASSVTIAVLWAASRSALSAVRQILLDSGRGALQSVWLHCVGGAAILSNKVLMLTLKSAVLPPHPRTQQASTPGRRAIV